MSDKIIITAETGSDITSELAQKYGITLIPMHVTLGDRTLDDGSFPPEDVCAYYNETRKCPTTSGSTPNDFEQVYDRLFEENSDIQILHLAYSAVTTCSYNSCITAIEGKPYQKKVRAVDTKHVSVGQCAVVIAVAEWLANHPDATLDDAAAAAVQISEKVQMCFIPDNLDYLRAGGRCSNATALVGNLLQAFSTKHNLKKDHLYFINTPYMDTQIKTALELEASKMGFEKITWIKTGCVITCHGGPGAFGIVGMME